jgi:hypothetical protein
MRRLLTLVMLFLFLSSLGYSQSKFVIQNKRQSSRVNFKLINNLIIIPVEINGVELSFLLDTGVSKPIIFNFLNISDTLKLIDSETIYLRGLGDGNSVKAIKSENNIFKIGDALKLNQDVYEIFDSNLNFAPRLGVPVHGIIGFDVFKDLVVEINYTGQYIRLISPSIYKYRKCKKCEILYLEFYNNKPYLNAAVSVNNKNIPIKLLIDSGGSDALWLFEDDSLGIELTHPFFEDFLGYGLGGSVYGKRSTIDALILKSFVIEDANVAYPENASIISAKINKDRNGTLAGNILKRFNIIVDYKNAKISLKKNSLFREKFSYNKSGIELAHDGVRLVKEYDNKVISNKFDVPQNEELNNSTRIVLDMKYKLTLKPAYSIVELRKDSPAYNAGLKINDVILSINGKAAHEYTLQQIIHMFYNEDGKHIKLVIDRGGRTLTFSFYLQSPLKIKT